MDIRRALARCFYHPSTYRATNPFKKSDEISHKGANKKSDDHTNAHSQSNMVAHKPPHQCPTKHDQHDQQSHFISNKHVK